MANSIVSSLAYEALDIIRSYYRNSLSINRSTVVSKLITLYEKISPCSESQDSFNLAFHACKAINQFLFRVNRESGISIVKDKLLQCPLPNICSIEKATSTDFDDPANIESKGIPHKVEVNKLLNVYHELKSINKQIVFHSNRVSAFALQYDLKQTEFDTLLLKCIPSFSPLDRIDEDFSCSSNDKSRIEPGSSFSSKNPENILASSFIENSSEESSCLNPSVSRLTDDYYFNSSTCSRSYTSSKFTPARSSISESHRIEEQSISSMPSLVDPPAVVSNETPIENPVTDSGKVVLESPVVNRPTSGKFPILLSPKHYRHSMKSPVNYRHSMKSPVNYRHRTQSPVVSRHSTNGCFPTISPYNEGNKHSYPKNNRYRNQCTYQDITEYPAGYRKQSPRNSRHSNYETSSTCTSCTYNWVRPMPRKAQNKPFHSLMTETQFASSNCCFLLRAISNALIPYGNYSFF